MVIPIEKGEESSFAFFQGGTHTYPSNCLTRQVTYTLDQWWIPTNGNRPAHNQYNPDLTDTSV